MKRWDAIVETPEGEEVRMVLRGKTIWKAVLNGLDYKGVSSILSVTERVVERTFPEPPPHLIDIHYRPLKRQDGKVMYG